MPTASNTTRQPDFLGQAERGEELFESDPFLVKLFGMIGCQVMSGLKGRLRFASS